VNFASLNLSATDANQFTVTSYGTLKTQIIPLLIYNKRLEVLKLLHQRRCFKNNVVSSFKHTNNIAGSVSAATASLTATEVARQAISKLGLNGSTVVNYADKRCSTVRLGTSALQLPNLFQEQ
jgi:hypothetical protein